MKISLKTVLSFLTIFFLLSCAEQEADTVKENDKQLNITILLDLSDRISPIINPSNPSHKDRDLEIVKYIAAGFREDMEKKGVFGARGRIKIIFTPVPEDENINALVRELNIDLSNKKAKEKKKIHDETETIFISHLGTIYEKTISEKKWLGSDIWRFFKNDIADFCISRDPKYRNILVVLTDGYIYHKDSKDRQKNRYAYLTSTLIESYGLRNNPNWEKKADDLDFGLIAKRNDLSDLEILILEIEPSKSHKNDEDIIRKILSKWLEEMGVKKENFRIYNSEVPSLTKSRIEEFLFNAD